MQFLCNFISLNFQVPQSWILTYITKTKTIFSAFGREGPLVFQLRSWFTYLAGRNTLYTWYIPKFVDMDIGCAW